MADLISELHIPKLRNDDDIFDRLNRRYTPIMLGLFALIVSSEQYVGDPIQCWAPNHFSKGQIAYTNDYCWMAGTYYHSFNKTFLGIRLSRSLLDKL